MTWYVTIKRLIYKIFSEQSAYLFDNFKLDKDKIKEVLQLWADFKGYELSPVFSFITTSVHNFRGPDERNEKCINGRLF